MICVFVHQAGFFSISKYRLSFASPPPPLQMVTMVTKVDLAGTKVEKELAQVFHSIMQVKFIVRGGLKRFTVETRDLMALVSVA